MIKDENFGGGEADFDGIQLRAGNCMNAPSSLCALAAPPGCP
jgi:hypothetical protein